MAFFRALGGTRPWIAYSWGYEVLLSRAYAWFGLVGFAMFGILLTMAVTFALFWMLHRLSGRFWVAWILALVGSFAYLFSLMPRPVFVTMILFTIVLTFLLEAQRTGRMQLLWWLPLVFVLWANIHIQFIYGLFAWDSSWGSTCFSGWQVGSNRSDFIPAPTLASVRADRGFVGLFCCDVCWSRTRIICITSWRRIPTRTCPIT